MRILVLGGTLFLGRHLVEAGMTAGHEITLFNRGVTRPDLFSDVEKLRGDRDGDLSALQGGAWDAVIDTSGYLPRVVGASVDLLSDVVDRYVFVSSCSVYADTREVGLDESAPVAALEDERSEDLQRHYGALKARCEQVVQQRFRDRAIIVRPGLIVGPHDPTNRFTYWVTRIASGGRVLAPRPEDQPVQFLDARDLSEWMIRMIENSASGVYNAMGPRTPLSMRTALDATNHALLGGARITWVDEAFLLEHGVEPWTELPLWLAPASSPEGRGFLAFDISRAVAAGLSFRSLYVTARDTLEWAASGSAGSPLVTGVAPAGLTRAREAQLLESWDLVDATHGPWASE